MRRALLVLLVAAVIGRSEVVYKVRLSAGKEAPSSNSRRRGMWLPFSPEKLAPFEMKKR